MNKIEESRNYISKVLDQEAKAEEDIKSSMRTHIRNIITASFGFGIKGNLFQFSFNSDLEKQIDAILAKFKDSVYEITSKRVLMAKNVSEGQYKTNIEDALVLGFIFGKMGEYTFRERLSKYTLQLKMEIEAGIAAGLYKNMSQNQILNEIINNAKNPYLSKSIREAMRKGGFASARIKSKGITYGTGRYISSLLNLKRIEVTAIAQAYDYTNHLIWKSDKKIIGFYRFTNSSRPCQACIDLVGFHSAKVGFIFVHSYCVCGEHPVYEGEKF